MSTMNKTFEELLCDKLLVSNAERQDMKYISHPMYKILIKAIRGVVKAQPETVHSS